MTVSAPETTGGIAYNATAAQVETALEALTSITGVTVFKHASDDIWWVFFDTAPQAGTDVVPLVPISSLTGGSPTVTVIERRRGRTGVNAMQEIRVQGATGGTFTLSYQEITTNLTELQIAMLWIDTVFRANTDIANLINPSREEYIAPDRLPFIDVAVVGSAVELKPSTWQTGFVYGQVQSSDCTPHISGERVFSTVHVSVEMQCKAGRYDQRLQAGGLLIDELFNQKKQITVSSGGTTYGTIVSCDRVSEINTSAVNSNGTPIYRKGGVFEIDVEKV